MLAQRGYSNIRVFDRLGKPASADDTEYWGNISDRFYNIGLNGRGQRLLRSLNMMNTIDRFATLVVGRLDWTPQTPVNNPNEILYTDKRSYITRCLERDRLTACLLYEIEKKYLDVIDVQFNMECTSVSWSLEGKHEVCDVRLQRNTKNYAVSGPNILKVSSPFVIGADGVQSTIKKYIEKDVKGFCSKRYLDSNVRVYRTIPLYFEKDTDPSLRSRRKDLNYSVRTKHDIVLDALPVREGGYIAVILFRPWNELIKNLKTGKDAREFFNKVFPMFATCIQDDDLERFAKQKDSRLPTFSYAGPMLHR